MITIVIRSNTYHLYSIDDVPHNLTKLIITEIPSFNEYIITYPNIEKKEINGNIETIITLSEISNYIRKNDNFWTIKCMMSGNDSYLEMINSDNRTVYGSTNIERINVKRKNIIPDPEEVIILSA